ncbi:MAG: hypothetical protein PVH41_11835 [Anaerolineae bacterium]|jgi:hypothetical protein
MNKRVRLIAKRLINVGTPLVLMGGLWLYLWVFQWFDAYLYDPRWGHNYLEAAAFLIAGLAYFNRRLISQVISLIAATMIVPVALELLPHSATAIAGAVLIVLTIVDIFVERGREADLAQPTNRRIAFWLKRHLPRFTYVMLAHLALIYFLVRLPAGTYETDLVTKVYDAALFPLAILALLEGMAKKLGNIPVPWLSFFWGMATIIVSLIILIQQPETWVPMGIATIATAAGIVALVLAQRDKGRAAT